MVWGSGNMDQDQGSMDGVNHAGQSHQKYSVLVIKKYTIIKNDSSALHFKPKNLDMIKMAPSEPSPCTSVGRV